MLDQHDKLEIGTVGDREGDLLVEEAALARVVEGPLAARAVHHGMFAPTPAKAVHGAGRGQDLKRCVSEMAAGSARNSASTRRAFRCQSGDYLARGRAEKAWQQIAVAAAEPAYEQPRRLLVPGARVPQRIKDVGGTVDGSDGAAQ